MSRGGKREAVRAQRLSLKGIEEILESRVTIITAVISVRDSSGKPTACEDLKRIARPEGNGQKPGKKDKKQ